MYLVVFNFFQVWLVWQTNTKPKLVLQINKYGLKLEKEGFYYGYNSSIDPTKFLCNLLEPHVPLDYNVRDTFSFVQEINQLSTSGKFMISFDVESLFTSIPLDECIDLAIKYIYQGNPGLKISPTDLKTLFSFATAEIHFLFKGVFYNQIDEVGMGSPLAPVLANLFMGHWEKKLVR